MSVHSHNRKLALPQEVERWWLITLREKLIKIGAKVVRHGRYVTFQLAEVAVPRELQRLEARIALEAGLGLLRLRQVQIGGRDRLDPEGPQHIADLANIAGVVRGDDQPGLAEGPPHVSAAFCAATSSVTPLRASRSISS